MNFLYTVVKDEIVVASGHCTERSLIPIPAEGETILEGVAHPSTQPNDNGEMCLTRIRGGRVVLEPIPIPVEAKRRWEYPPIEEQLDAIWKGGEAMEEMRQRVLAVKQKFPKGSQQ
jgi:hypothetical protein